MIEPAVRSRSSGSGLKGALDRPHLNGARFSIPSADIEETKATGRGTIPDIMIEYTRLVTVNK